MKKLDRFLLAENPMTDGGEAIIHTIDPIAIIVVEPSDGYVIRGDSDTRKLKSFKYKEWEYFTLYVHHYFTTNMNLLDEEEGKNATDKLLDRAWHWYKAYLEWEDKNIDKDEEAGKNQG